MRFGEDSWRRNIRQTRQHRLPAGVHFVRPLDKIGVLRLPGMVAPVPDERETGAVNLVYSAARTADVRDQRLIDVPAQASPPARLLQVVVRDEQGSDVNLAAHLVRDAFQRTFEVAVLITNDSDLSEPVRIVRQEQNLPVGILNPHQQHSAELKRVATVLKRIRQFDLIASQFSPVLTDAKGTLHKPASW